jgi:hypothetical protein
MAGETLVDPRAVPVDIAMPTPEPNESPGLEVIEYLGVEMTVATMNAIIEQQNKG